MKIECDRGSKFYISNFQNLKKVKKIHHYSRYTDEGPSIANKEIPSLKRFLEEPVIGEGNADWLSELPVVSIKKYNGNIHHSTKMKPIEAFKKENEKIVFPNREDRTQNINQIILLEI